MQEKVPQLRVTDTLSFDFNERFPTFSSGTLNALSFGYSRLFSTILWIRFLQETPTYKVPPGQLSWIYRDLDAILDIDPDFYPAVDEGAIFLSVITEDKVGAERLLQKSIGISPNRWRPYFFLGYHYLQELKDIEKAANTFQEGALKPQAPPVMGLLATTLTQKLKGRAAALMLLQGMISQAKDPNLREKLLQKLAKLEKESGNGQPSD